MKQEIRKLLETDKVIIGTQRTIKALRAGKLSKVLLCTNCSAQTVQLIREIAGTTKVEQMQETNEEVGVLCKKPFRIAVLGIL